MFTPASFDDAAARFLEETDLPSHFRWDPRSRRWSLLEDGTWSYVPTEVAVTYVGRYIADEFQMQEAQGKPIPSVLSGVPNAQTWPHLRAKVNRSQANAVTRLASGSRSFCDLPSGTATPRSTDADLSVEAGVSAWIRSTVVPVEGTFLLRSAVTRAFRDAHAQARDLPSRQVVCRAAENVLGAPRKRAGQYGWIGHAMSDPATAAPAEGRGPGKEPVVG